jgi:hypothetical protein
MIRRLAFTALAALFLLGTTSCGKKEEAPKETEDLQMQAPAAVQPAGADGVQAG